MIVQNRVPENKQTRQLRLLNEVSAKLQRLLESDDFFREVINVIQSQFNIYASQIWSVEEHLNYRLRAQAGAYNPHLKIGHTLSCHEGIIGFVVRTKKTYLSNDVTNDSNYTNLSLPIYTKSQLSIPVISDNQVLAVLSVEADRPNFFDDDDVITLESVASQIAVALKNQRLFRDVTSFNQRLQVAVEEKTLELRKASDQILKQQRLLQKENKNLKTLVTRQQDDGGSMTIGESLAIQNILSMVSKIAPTTATVLIQGESGTGKELVARSLHNESHRVNKPFVTVNCGALQESLLESELFGHEKGSFTGAVAQKIGLAEVAEGGTLFLDEIGELSPSIQAKLLRFLQEGEFYRIGGKKPLKVDVRVISATNRDLESEVKEGGFREDLFYRLNTITLRMPPLRERREDIPLLIEYFLSHPRFGGTPGRVKKVDGKVMEVLMKYDWPGNIRELQNTIERLQILSETNEIGLEDLPFNIRMPKTKLNNGAFSITMPLEEVEKNHILRTLVYNHGNKTRTAKSLGITIKTLYNKLHKYDKDSSHILDEIAQTQNQGH